MPVSIDEFKSKPDSTFTAQERIRFACFGFEELNPTAPIVYGPTGLITDLLSVYGITWNSIKGG